jgi:hypothetical protein
MFNTLRAKLLDYPLVPDHEGVVSTGGSIGPLHGISASRIFVRPNSGNRSLKQLSGSAGQ